MSLIKAMVKNCIFAGILGIILTGFFSEIQGQGRQSPLQDNQLKSEDVSKKEIKSFIKAANKIRPLQSQARQEIISTIKSSDMEVQRFQEISQAQRNPAGKDTMEISKEEESTYNTISKKSRKIQRETQTKMKKEVEKTGMKWKKFQQISLALRSNPDLQQKFKAVQQEQRQQN